MKDKLSEEAGHRAKTFPERKADEALLTLANLERTRALCPSELVLRGRSIQIGSGAIIADYKEAEKAFRAALEIDPFYVPALLELGWFHYAPEDDPATALPFFEKAIEVSLEQLKEGLRGKVGCLEELESSEMAGDFLRQFSQDALKLEDLEGKEEEDEGKIP